MANKYISKTDGLDPERGNVLMLRREDVEPLVRSLVAEITAPIFDGLIRWFAGGSDKPLDNPLANAMLEQFKARQREAVKKYFDTCEARRPKTAKETQGDISIDKPQIKETELNKLNELTESNSSVQFRDKSSDGESPALDAQASRPQSGSKNAQAITKADIVNAKQTLARWATAPTFKIGMSPSCYCPDHPFYNGVCKENCDNCDRITDEGKRPPNCTRCEKPSSLFFDARIDRYLQDTEGICLADAAELKDGGGQDLQGDELKARKNLLKAFSEQTFDELSKHPDRATDRLLKAIKEKSEAERATLNRRADELGSSYVRAAWTFLIEAATEKFKETDNLAAILNSRLTKLSEAKALLDFAHETITSLPMPPTPPTRATRG